MKVIRELKPKPKPKPPERVPPQPPVEPQEEGGEAPDAADQTRLLREQGRDEPAEGRTPSDERRG